MRYALAFCSFLAAAPVFAQSDRLPPDLALVPEDGLGFVHVRIADLWRHESMKEIRDVVKKAGDRAIAALDKRFASLPSNIERLTLWVGPVRTGRRGDFVELFVVRLSRPTDAGALRKLLLPEATEKKGKRFSWFSDELGASLLIADDRTFVVGPKKEIGRIADGTTTGATPLRDAITVAAGDRYLVAAANVPAMPRDVLFDLQRELPKELQPVLDAQCATASLDLAGEGHLHLRLQYSTDATADKAAGLLKAPDGPARKLIADTRRDLETLIADDKTLGLEQIPLTAAAVLGLGVLKQTEDVIASDKLRRDGAVLSAAIELPSRSKTIVVPAAFAAAVKLAHLATLWRDEVHRQHTSSLSELLLALHNYHDVNNDVPVAITNADGKSLLSWRVALLPFIEQDNLFKRFKLDEPWDSEHNKTLIEQMPKIFEIEGVTAKAGHTHYRTFVGEKAAWMSGRPLKFSTFMDGLSNSAIFFQAAEPVIWTKPDELEFDGKMAVKSRLLFREGRTVIGMGDGMVRIVPETIAEDVWKMLVDPADGQPIPDGVFKK